MSGRKPQLPDQAGRDRIRRELDRNIIVEAAAGTGKTESMTGRMVELIAAGKCGIAGIAAVTFTRKAAAELRGRFRLALEAAAADPARSPVERKLLAQGLADADRCYIGTIHSFCARLLRERPVEAGIDASFSEIDDADDQILRDEAWNECLRQLYTDERDPLLSALLEQQVDVVELKGAFARFAEYPDVAEWPEPEFWTDEFLRQYLTKLNQVVKHIAEVSELLPADMGNDELGRCYKIVRRVNKHTGKMDNLPECEPVLGQLTRNPKLVQKGWKADGRFTGEDAKQEKGKWDHNRDELALPLLRELRRRRYPLVLQLMERAKKVYDNRRKQLGALNFQDLLIGARDLLRDNPLVRRDFALRYQRILVDEFQDTDPIQAELLFLLTSSDNREKEWRNCRPKAGSLFVVGDPKQSIYRFRRADIMTYNQVKEILLGAPGSSPALHPGPPGSSPALDPDAGLEPGAPTSGLLLRLQANFRATPAIIKSINEIFAPGPDAEADGELLRFPEESTDQSPAYVSLEPGRPDTPRVPFEGVYRLAVPPEYKNQPTICAWESGVIARFIRRAVDAGMELPPGPHDEPGKPRPARFGDFLIVTRNTHRLNIYAQALARYGIPHQVTGGSALSQVGELELLRLALLAVAHPDNPVHLLSVLRSELFGLSDRDLYFLKRAGGRFSWQAPAPERLPEPAASRIGLALAALKKYAGWFAVMPSAAALERMAGDLGLPALAAARDGGNERAGGLMKVIELARASEREAWSPAQLAEYLTALAEAEETYDSLPARSPEESVVRVMNLHKVKGLEAPVVFLADPNGDREHAPDLHIERGPEGATGYMVFTGEDDIIAEPGDWDEIAAREAGFSRAEELRLRYVAATRAGVALIVSIRELFKNKNPWRHFESLASVPFPAPEEFEPAAAETVSISADEPGRVSAEITRRMGVCFRATHRTASARELALPPRPDASAGQAESTSPDLGEHGLEWGALVHSTLQAAMDRPSAEVTELATAFAREQGQDPRLGLAAAEAAKSIVASEIWRRAQKSTERYTELPFEMMKDTNEGPVLVRGALDLIFKEGDGWVLIDYKTDLLNRRKAADLAAYYRPQLLLYAEAFSRLTGGKVKEAGFYFLREDRTEWIKL